MSNAKKNGIINPILFFFSLGKRILSMVCVCVWNLIFYDEILSRISRYNEWMKDDIIVFGFGFFFGYTKQWDNVMK